MISAGRFSVTTLMMYPPDPLQELQPANVFEVLMSVDAMMVTVVFDGDHEIWPAHIEVSDRRDRATPNTGICV